ncbi:hypothetical protein SLE2022_250710 [Rubroshorea leprosula]
MQLGAPAKVKVATDLIEVLIRGTELASANGATEDDDGEDKTQDRDLQMTESSLDLSRSLRSQTLVNHFSLSPLQRLALS